ncbi:hypothetical protein PLICRDRAFT_123678 [Plicaturopsis crispa FD-325 SS-3]|nr:hypothetical protein PLICRDRAFT_123678 [Plicaturopsis crispa FD-325 SS-3]
MEQELELGPQTEEVVYNAEDLKGKSRDELIQFVLRQPGRWPFNDGKRKFSRSKTNIASMKSVLLKADYGFTKLRVVATASPGPPSLSNPRTLEPTREQPIPAEDLFDSPTRQGAAVRLPTRREVRLCIEDRRSPGEPVKTVCLISVAPIGSIVLGAAEYEEWRVNANDMLRELQHSCAAINGDVKLSFPDPIAIGYDHPFVRMEKGELLHEAPTSPSELVIPPSNILKIFVDSTTTNAASATTSVLSSGELAHQQPLLNTSDAPTKKRRKVSPDELVAKRLVTGDSEAAELQWLVEEVSHRPFYAEFKARRGHVQRNPEIVQSWEFAVTFVHDYVGCPSPSRVSARGGRKSIKKGTIEAALNVKSTWMFGAEKAMRIIRIYGAGGSHPSQDFIEQLELDTDKPLGAVALLDYLQTYQNEHPVVSS